jgi:hypothetical protein
MFNTLLYWLIAVLQNPFIFIPGVTYLMWMAAVHYVFPCMFIAGFLVGPCHELGFSNHHNRAYLCTGVVGGVCFLISRARPHIFTTLWFTLPFFFLMGFYLSWMLSEEERKDRED